MSGIFNNPTMPQRHTSYRQKSYLKARKTDRPRVVKHEQQVQLQLCDWLRATLPHIHFRSDTASGAFNSKHEKDLHNRQQSGDSEPDLMIFAARHGYHGLVIELKAEGVNLRMQQNGRKIRVYKDSRGRITGRDYKIRMKGDWANLHIEKQAKCLEDYNAQGYLGRFAVGLEPAKRLICWYFDIPYIENAELF